MNAEFIYKIMLRYHWTDYWLQLEYQCLDDYKWNSSQKKNKKQGSISLTSVFIKLLNKIYV